MPGEFPRLVVFKARGPSLRAFGVSAPLANPTLVLYRGDEKVLENDDWTSLHDFEKRYVRQLFPTPDDPRESAIATYLDPGVYSAVIAGADGSGGVALLEVYIQDRFVIGL